MNQFSIGRVRCRFIEKHPVGLQSDIIVKAVLLVGTQVGTPSGTCRGEFTSPSAAKAGMAGVLVPSPKFTRNKLLILNRTERASSLESL